MKNNSPLVSICCATYNHEEYIEETLKGFLMQECDFEYEILIHDDASTDKTADIIKKYEEKYPHIIFPIYQVENQYSQGKKYSDLNYERARGKYIALCEGDDCWLDPKKLAIQIKAFKLNPKCGICFHPSISLNCLTNNKVVIGKYDNKDSIVDINDVIIKKHEMIPTAACIVTKEVLKRVLEYKSTRTYLTVGDLYFQIFGALDAGAIYVDKVMSLYRHFTPHSWSIAQQKSLKNQFKHLSAMAKSYQELDQMTDYKYTKAFQQSTIKRLFSVSGYEGLCDIPKEFELYKKQFLNLLDNLSKKKYIIYGAGSTSKLILDYLPEKVDYLIDYDNTKHNQLFKGKMIQSLSNYKPSPNDNIIISLVGRSSEIKKLLIESYSLKEEQIVTLEDDLIKNNILKKLIFQ